jgi:hypothetical protein
VDIECGLGSHHATSLLSEICRSSLFESLPQTVEKAMRQSPSRMSVETASVVDGPVNTMGFEEQSKVDGCVFH